ncbi:MAG: ferritin family protein [Candidatus Omnitrophota bacterium]|nr:MAG: ferritin family protein [Candidatus Omnitrophota bacterium]
MKIELKHGQFVITDFNEFEAYRIASKIEKDGMRFYSKLFECAKDAATKKALEFLIVEEKKHLNFFEDCIDKLRQVKEDTTEESDLLTTMDFGIFEPYQNMVEACKIVDDKKKAFNLGILVEERSVSFYETCKKHVSSSETKEALDNIIADEKQHKKELEKMLQGV